MRQITLNMETLAAEHPRVEGDQEMVSVPLKTREDILHAIVALQARTLPEDAASALARARGLVEAPLASTDNLSPLRIGAARGAVIEAMQSVLCREDFASIPRGEPKTHITLTDEIIGAGLDVRDGIIGIMHAAREKWQAWWKLPQPDRATWSPNSATPKQPHFTDALRHAATFL